MVSRIPFRINAIDIRASLLEHLAAVVVLVVGSARRRLGGGGAAAAVVVVDGGGPDDGHGAEMAAACDLEEARTAKNFLGKLTHVSNSSRLTSVEQVF